MSDDTKQIDYSQITSLIEQSLNSSLETEKNTQTVLSDIKKELPDVAKTSKFDFDSIKALIDKSYIKSFGDINSDDEIYKCLIKDIKDLFENFESVKTNTDNTSTVTEKENEILSEEENIDTESEENDEEQILSLLNDFISQLNTLVDTESVNIETDDGLNQFSNLYSDFLSELDKSDLFDSLFTEDGLLNDKVFKYLNQIDLEQELNLTDLSKASSTKKKKKTFRDYYNIASDRKADSISGGIAKTISGSVNKVLNVAETIKDSFNVIRHPIETINRVKEEGFDSLFKSKSNEELLKVGIGKNTLNTELVLKNTASGVSIKWLYELLNKKRILDEKKKLEEDKAKELEQSGSDVANGIADMSGGLTGGFDMKTIGIIVASVAAIALGGWLIKKFFDSTKEKEETNKPTNKPEKELDEEKPKPTETKPKPNKLAPPITEQKNETVPDNKQINEKPKEPTAPSNVANNKFNDTQKNIDKDTKEYSKDIKNKKSKNTQIKSNAIDNDRKEELEEQKRQLKKEEELAEALDEQSKNTIQLKDLAEPSLWDKFTKWIKEMGSGVKDWLSDKYTKTKEWLSNKGISVDLGEFKGIAKKGTKVTGIAEGVITSDFGFRNHPVYGVKKMHHGVDIAGKTNSRVNSATSGKVIFAGQQRGYGNIVIIRDSEGRQFKYAHLNNYNVKKGDEIKQGQFIGGMGNTGIGTGTHLHFEVKDKSGKSISPYEFLGVKLKETPSPENIVNEKEDEKLPKTEQTEQRPITKAVAEKNKRDTEKKIKSTEDYNIKLGEKIGIKFSEQKKEEPIKDIIRKNEEHENIMTMAINGGDDFINAGIDMQFATGR